MTTLSAQISQRPYPVYASTLHPFSGYPIEPRPGASLWSFMCLRDYSGGLDRRANGPSAVGTLLPLSSV